MILTILDIGSLIFGLIQGILILYKKKINWIFYILMCLCIMGFAFGSQLYALGIEYIIYFTIGLFGTFVWYKKEDSIKFSYLTNKQRIIYFILSCSISICISQFLSFTNDPLPKLDGITTGFGLVATYLMSIKKIEAWIMWFITDILMCIMFFMLPDNGLYILILNIIWTFLAVGSFYKWKQK